MELKEQTIRRIASQMGRGELVLFTGAGFSLGAKDVTGAPVPSASELREELWRLAYGDEPLDPATTLGDIFEVLKNKDAPTLTRFLQRRLCVDPKSTQPWQRHFLDMPWFRIYTLNVDNLELAVDMQYGLRREPTPLSALVEVPTDAQPPRQGRAPVEIVHLNGRVSDGAAKIVFSERQYADQSVLPSAWYQRCASDLACRPVLFVGTELREPPLWQHIEARRQRDMGQASSRPTAILVTPRIDRARSELLSALRVEHVPMTAEAFANEVLSLLLDDANRGFVFLSERRPDLGASSLSMVSELAVDNARLETEYLMGEEPHWSDIRMGRAAIRTVDTNLVPTAREMLVERDSPRVLVISGTAGSGKSTSLMRLSLALSDEGIPVLWCDASSSVTPAIVRQQLSKLKGPAVIAIDDAGNIGTSFVSMLGDVIRGQRNTLAILAVRAHKLERLQELMASVGDLQTSECSVEGLTDADIDSLLDVLMKYRRLGVLRGKTRREQQEAFKVHAARQLLVAMIGATSGQKLEDKAIDELRGLTGISARAYALVCVATSRQQSLLKDEVVLAFGDDGATALDAVERLVAMHMVIKRPPMYEFRARHRVVADLVVGELQGSGLLAAPLVGLARAAAAKVDQRMERSSRPWKMLRSFISHGYLGQVLEITQARRVYAAIEELVAFDYHYWLQRGSLEVEKSEDLRLAEQFLGQAMALAGGEYQVRTEFGYLLMKKAIAQPGSPRATAWLEEGMRLLEGVIASRGKTDAFPYHVLGSQGLSWVRRGISRTSDKGAFLDRLIDIVQEGVDRHRFARDLLQLREDIKKERLLLTVG